ncbi:MAG: glycosyltransferase, partial [Rhizomicrobium sp.]
MPSKIEAPIVLLSVFPSFQIGGAQVRFASLANHFGRKFRHLIISLNGGDDCMARLDPGLDVTLLPFENRKETSLGNRARLRALLKSCKPDLLITHNWGSIDWGLANWPRVVPHVHIEDGFGPEEAGRQLPRRVWTRRLVLRNSMVVVPSRALRKIALDIWKLKPASVHYIPNGIDVARFARADIEPVLARTDVPTMGTVAALRPEKNLFRLLDAFAVLRGQRPCKLIIAGDGSERTGLEARAVALGLEDDVLFTGYRRDTERVYAAMDVFA